MPAFAGMTSFLLRPHHLPILQGVLIARSCSHRSTAESGIIHECFYGNRRHAGAINTYSHSPMTESEFGSLPEECEDDHR